MKGVNTKPCFPSTHKNKHTLTHRNFDLETWSFVSSPSRWRRIAKTHGWEATGCGPRLEFLYKVALLVERNCFVIWRELCLLSRRTLPARPPVWISPLCDKNLQNKNPTFVQECSAVEVCLMSTITNFIFHICSLISLPWLYFGLHAHLWSESLLLVTNASCLLHDQEQRQESTSYIEVVWPHVPVLDFFYWSFSLPEWTCCQRTGSTSCSPNQQSTLSTSRDVGRSFKINWVFTTHRELKITGYVSVSVLSIRDVREGRSRLGHFWWT